MISSNFLKRCFQRPNTTLNIDEEIKSYLGDRIKPSFLTRPISFLSDYVLSNMPSIQIPQIPKILMSHLPQIPVPQLSQISNIPQLKLVVIVLKTLSEGIFSLVNLVFSSVAAITGSIGALGVVLLIIVVLVVMLILWHFFFNDRDFSLFELEYFGKGIKQYSGKVVWIVGASTILGQSIALELASVGAKIILSARRTHILQKLKADCVENSKGKLSESDILVLPLTITAMNEEYFQTVIEHFGEIDVFIDNTSHTALGEAFNASIGMDKAIFDVNFFGPIFLIKKVVNHFKETNGGQIIVVSSISGKFGIPGQATASATKQALNMYLEVLRLECTGHKIYITTVCLGLISSSVTDHSVLARTDVINQEEELKMTQGGLRTKRCAHLILVAGANRCTECWVSNQPFLFLVYVAQYCPWIHKIIMSYIFSDERLEKIYEGKSPNIRMWKPVLFVI